MCVHMRPALAQALAQARAFFKADFQKAQAHSATLLAEVTSVLRR